MKNRVCFFSQMYQSIPSLEVIQRELGGVFVCGRASTMRYFRRENPELSSARLTKRFKRFSAGYNEMLNANCIVTGSPYKSLLSPYSGKKLMVFHGTYGAMSSDVLKELSHFDHLFLIGDRMERAFLRHQKDKEFNYTKTGFIPFNNFTDKNEINRKAVLNTINLDPDLKTIVYCPSRRGYGSWELCVKELLKGISSEFNLILRPHPSQSMNLRWHEKSRMKELQSMAGQRGNTVIDLVDVALSDILMVADLLISDSNSPSEEALFYDTPHLLTGLANCSYGKFEGRLANLGMEEEDIKDVLQIFDCGPVYSQEKYCSWQEAVDDALSRETDYRGSREAAFSSIFGQRDRDAGHRVAEIIRSEYL